LDMRRSGASRPQISPGNFAAVIFDLDGVVTRTAVVHARAWKSLFDDYLGKRAARLGEEFRPFDIEHDYRGYVDGRPRYDGVECFLRSRQIDIPRGDPKDSPDQETVCGLGNRKNGIFLELLRRSGVEVYPSSVALIHELRAVHIKTAIVSSSENCLTVLEAAGITGLFDARVDGSHKESLSLEGKPAPDFFLEAARRLGVEPQRAVVIEDAVAGVEAGRRGGFGLVLGVNRGIQEEALLLGGADDVVRDLSEVSVGDGGRGRPADVGVPPSALECLDEIRSRVGGRQLAIFLDYDGTLTPIVDRPDAALLSDEMRSVLRRLTGCFPVSVISGRGLDDVRELISLDNIYYAGCHGFEIQAPGEEDRQPERVNEFLPALDGAERELRSMVGSLSGAIIERKRFTIAVHYRMVAKENAGKVAEAVRRVERLHPELHKAGGKMIYELKPGIDWDKGKALLQMLKMVGSERGETVPLYLGDDLTDEDAFRAIENIGIGIVVMSPPRKTAAHYALENTGEVRRFLESLLVWDEAGKRP